MKQKLFVLLLTLALVLGLAVTVSAAEEITSGDWTYRVSDGKAVLCRYNGTDTEIIVPAEIDGYDVSELGPGVFLAFGNVADTMTSVTLSDGIEGINTNAFNGCTALKTVHIPGSVRWISTYAFYDCTALTELYLEEGIGTISPFAFANTNLSSVLIPASVTEIGEKAFGYAGEWGNAEQIDTFGIFGYTGTAAQKYAQKWHFSFYRLDDMTDVSGRCGDHATWRFEESSGTLYLESTGNTDGACSTDPYYNGIQPWIAYADSIRRVVIGEGITSLGDESFAYYYPNLAEVILPESLGSLGNGALRDCIGLKTIELPQELSFIGGSALRGTGLTSIVLPGADDFYSSYLGGRSLADCPDLETVYFCGDSWEFGKEVFLNDDLNVWYPLNNSTWNRVAGESYGGNVTWLAYDPELFLDVAVDSFYHEPVLWAVTNGITTGATETTFDPNGSCLRAQVVTFLHRAEGNPEPVSNSNPFTDVKSSDFFYKPVLWAVEQEITNGISANEFGSYTTCNRAAVVTFLWRAAGSPEPKTTEHPFIDVPAGTFYEKAVLWAMENGITNGISATEFGPTAPCNRAQVVTFLYRAKDIPKTEPAQSFTFELRSNDPTGELGFVYCEETTFSAGQSVIFYAEPRYGYLVEFEVVCDAQELELNYLGAYTYELIMPNADVILTANFVPAQGEAHFITTDCVGGFAMAFCDSDDELNCFAKPGEYIQIMILPEEGFTFSPEACTITAGDDSQVSWWYLGELVEEDPEFGIIDGIFLVELLMPDADVHVSITCTAEAETAQADSVRIPVSVQ